MKQLIASGAELSLSAFEIGKDASVLRAPQGMLAALQHHGLDTSFRLSLPRTANDFPWKNVSDVELTLWFLAAYDDGLAQAQAETLWRQGQRGELQSAAAVRFPVDQPTQWADFLTGPPDPERLDLRYLVFDVPAAGPSESARLVTNLFLAIQRISGIADLPIRLCCDTDPVGVALILGANGLVYTSFGVTPTPTPPPDTTLKDWVTLKFYSAGLPIRDPKQRFVLKVSPGVAGTSWWKRDSQGVVATTLSGPLTGTNNGGTAGTATYNNGSAFLNATVRVKIAHRGGTAQIRIRGASGYALEISSTNVRILKAGAAQVTPSPALVYPSAEFLSVELKVWNQADGTAKIEGWIDGLRVIQFVDPSALIGAGTVVLAVTATAGGLVPVAFDDLEVHQLTGLGAQGAQLLFQPFTAALPTDWTFVNGSVAWVVSTTKHNLLDLSNLSGVGLKVDYQFKVLRS